MGNFQTDPWMSEQKKDENQEPWQVVWLKCSELAKYHKFEYITTFKMEALNGRKLQEENCSQKASRNWENAGTQSKKLQIKSEPMKANSLITKQ